MNVLRQKRVEQEREKDRCRGLTKADESRNRTCVHALHKFLERGLLTIVTRKKPQQNLALRGKIPSTSALFLSVGRFLMLRLAF